jgi:hypothetical protein
MWGWKAGRRSDHLKEFNKTLWTESQEGTSPEPRLNITDANVTLKKEDCSIIFGYFIISHWVCQDILAVSGCFSFCFFLSNVIIAHWE